jgi:hypothetical protein
MQGLVNFAQSCALIIAVLLPTAFYCSAIGLFLFAAWGLWQQAQPHNPFRGKPWIPVLSLLLSGASASFPVILNKVNVSAGSSVTVSVAADLSSYTATNAPDILGNTPGDAVLNIVQAFQGFFQTFGAMTCFLAMLAWRASVNGRSNRPWSGCCVQFVFGVLLMNIMTISQWLVGLFTSNAGVAT